MYIIYVLTVMILNEIQHKARTNIEKCLGGFNKILVNNIKSNLKCYKFQC